MRNSFHHVKMAPSFDLFSISIEEQESCKDLGKEETTSALEEECTKRNMKIRRASDHSSQLKWVLLAWKMRIAVSEILSFLQCLPPRPAPGAGLVCMAGCFPSHALIKQIFSSCLHLLLSIAAVTNNIFSLILFLPFFPP